MTDVFLTGKIGKTFGVEGDLVVNSYSGEWVHLIQLKQLHLIRNEREKWIDVVRWQEKGTYLLVRLAGFTAPETAQQWTGWEISITRDQGPALAQDEYFLSDLVHMNLTYQGTMRGKILGWIEGGAHPLLEVLLPDEKIVIIPFTQRFIGTVNTKIGEMELLLDWILE